VISLLLAAALVSGLARTQASSRESLRPVDAPDILEIVRQHRGQVVLLNFWATWCPPCIVEFPEIVSLEKTYRDHGLVVVSVSADFPKDIDSMLLPFLDKHRPSFPVYLKQTDDIDAFIRVIDSEWTGAIPATFFIDRGGIVTNKKFSAMSGEEMKRILEVLLEKSER